MSLGFPEMSFSRFEFAQATTDLGREFKTDGETKWPPITKTKTKTTTTDRLQAIIIDPFIFNLCPRRA